MPLPKKTIEPAPLTDEQKYLHGALSVTFKRCASNRHLIHADFLRVLEEYRDSFTEDYLERYPNHVTQLQSLLNSRKK